jgi:hypothetical protein
MIRYMIWYIELQLFYHPVALVQYTITHKQYIEEDNRHKQYIEQHISLIRKGADHAPSLRGIPGHLPYNWGKRRARNIVSYFISVKTVYFSCAVMFSLC